MGGGSYYESYLWKGQLYSNLICDNDTLKIYDNLYLDENLHLKTSIRINGKEIDALNKGEREPAEPLLLYSNIDLEYSLFTNNSKKLLIIQKKFKR